MIGKTILYIILFAMLITSGYFLYLAISDLYAEPVEFVEIKNQPILKNQSSYSSQLQFYPNMRFAEKEISYRIDNSCSDEKKERMKKAFDFLRQETGLLHFYENGNGIEVTCDIYSNEPSPGFYYIAGEGGPTSIINASSFYIIEKGKVLLFYNNSECDSFNIELHELLHVFGFEHSANSNSIMYNTSNCNQILTNDITDELKRLYSIKELPDILFSDISAVKKGSYLDFNVEIKNTGLENARNASLVLFSENNKIESFDLGDIGYGEGKQFWVKDMKIGRDLKELKFVLIIDEDMNNKNNVMSLSLA